MRTKIIVSVMLVGISTNLMANSCEIFTSPVDRVLLKEIQSSWNGRTVPIINPKTHKYTGFLEAYTSFDNSMKSMFKKESCSKEKWSGVANYKIAWNIGKSEYSFIATYDLIDYKKKYKSKSLK